MKLFTKHKKEIIVRQTQSADLQTIAHIHELSFEKAWSLDDINSMQAQDSMLLWTAQEVGGAVCGFNIMRSLSDEGEIISIAVHPNYRRQNIAEKLMRVAINHLLSEKKKKLFLEVAQSNQAALTLYKRLGFAIIDERKGYYARQNSAISALVMCLELV